MSIDISFNKDIKGEDFELDLKNQTEFPFQAIKEEVLGRNYDLGLVFCDTELIQQLNKQWRNKDSPTDVLSFPYDKNLGDIFICLPIAKQKAPEYDRDLKGFILFLYVHALHHLDGFEHGRDMDEAEAKIRKKFKI